MTAQASYVSGGGTGRALFVAGAGTGIGKTYLAATLTRRLRAAGRSVAALKPVASGVPPLDSPDFATSDTALLLAAQGLPVTAETVAACTPWRFAAPLAPDLAAVREGRSLALRDLVAWCRAQFTGPSHPPSHPQSLPQARSGARGVAEPRRSPPIGEQRSGGLLRDFGFATKPKDKREVRTYGAARRDPRGITLIEGVGGVMSPVTADATGLDWLKAMDLPALLVTGSYLGAISHALTAAETLAAHAVPLVAIVVSESEDAPLPPETVAQAIGRHAAAPVFALRRGAACPEALATLV